MTRGVTDRPLRIAFHAPRARFLSGGYTGDHVLAGALLAGLRERGHEVKVVTEVDVSEAARGRVPGRRLLRELVSVRRAMKAFAPDAWFVYGPAAAYPDLFGWWQRPKRYVLYQADAGRATRVPRRWRFLYGLAHRRSLARADVVGIYRPRTAERLRRGGVPADRLRVVLPAVRPWQELPSRQEARRTLGLDDEAPVILCVSRLARRRKDGRPGKAEMVLDLLAAFARLPSEARLVVIGDGHERRRVEEQAAALGLNDRLRLIRSVPDVGPYLAACDVFAYPYTLDRPWVSVLEAQAAGRPVVTMRTDSADLTIDPGRTGLLAADLQEFEQQLAALVADRRRCREMGRAARRYALGFHSLDVRIAQIEALLAEDADA